MISVLRSMQLAYFERPAVPDKHKFSCAQGLDEESCHCRQSFDFGLPSPLPSPVSNTRDEADPPAHPDSPYPHIFIVGDAADAFGALNAGHTAWTQAEVAARNIVKLIKTDGRARLIPAEEEAVGVKITRMPSASVNGDLKKKVWPLAPVSGMSDIKEIKPLTEEILERYDPPLPSIKVSLGLVCSSIFSFCHHPPVNCSYLRFVLPSETSCISDQWEIRLERTGRLLYRSRCA